MDPIAMMAYLNATPAVVVVCMMGFMFSLYVIVKFRGQQKRNDRLFKELKDVTYKYNVINTWAFAADKHIKLNGLKCGNSQGDVMLNWDGVPEPYQPPKGPKA